MYLLQLDLIDLENKNQINKTNTRTPKKNRERNEQTRKKNRGGKSAAANIFECYRINNGSVVMFKTTTAKYIYTKYAAKKVLDPTAGWGGRMLGAWAQGIDYIGIDTNVSLQESYEEMIQFLLKEYKY